MKKKEIDEQMAFDNNNNNCGFCVIAAEQHYAYSSLFAGFDDSYTLYVINV